MNDRLGLWQEVQRIRGRIISTENGKQSVLFGGGYVRNIHAVRILSTAQVTADRYVADAKACSSRLTEEARLRRAEIMSEAPQYSDMVLEDAHSRAREAAVSSLNTTVLPRPTSGTPRPRLAYLRTTAMFTGAPAPADRGHPARHRSAGRRH